MKKRGQIGVEYMIVIGFITFAIGSILVMSFFYSNQIKDRVKLNQVENFAVQLVNSAESVFFAGEPSKTTVRLYLPEGVSDIQIISNSLVITTSVSSGSNKRAFSSRVPIQGTIVPGPGVRKLTLIASSDYVTING